MPVCKVVHTSDEVSVTSTSGRTLTIAKDVLRFRSMPLYHKLTRHALNVLGDVELTIPQMQGFAEICGIVKAPSASTTKKEEVERAKNSIVEKAKNATIEETAIRTEYRTRGAGLDLDERRINQLQNVVKKVTNERFSMLIYDIPTVLNKECPNPSKTLWCYGFRLEKSCWVLPTSGLNSIEVKELIAHWKAYGVSTHIIPYSEEAQSQIREIARNKLTEEIIRVHEALINNIDNASKRLNDARNELASRATEATASDHERVEFLAIAGYRNAIRMATEALDYSLKCARLFDDEENVADLLKGLRAAVHSQRQSLKILLENRTRA